MKILLSFLLISSAMTTAFATSSEITPQAQVFQFGRTGKSPLNWKNLGPEDQSARSGEGGAWGPESGDLTAALLEGIIKNTIVDHCGNPEEISNRISEVVNANHWSLNIALNVDQQYCLEKK